jgi:hypothetical protein
VKRTHAWLVSMSKLRMRFGRRLDTHRALLSLAYSIICLRSSERFC